MRKYISKHIVHAPTSQVIEHFGLAYDMFAPIALKGDDLGKVPNDDRPPWFARLESITVPSGYRVSFKRWESSFSGSSSITVRLKTTSRLLVGYGNPAPTENGLTVHHTWGTPVIPGSALKGLLNHYVQIAYGPESNTDHPLDPNHSEPDRALYQGPYWEGKKIINSPGAVHRALFGAPEANTDQDHRETLNLSSEELGMARGAVIFHDALYTPNSHAKPFVRDILTPHNAKYYTQNDDGTRLPNDYDDPNPVGFMTVRPDVEFLIALSGPSEWLPFALTLLVEALTSWGIGGKTASGYGQFDQKSSPIRLNESIHSFQMLTFSPQQKAALWWSENGLSEDKVYAWVKDTMERSPNADTLGETAQLIRERIQTTKFRSLWKRGKTVTGFQNTPYPPIPKDREAAALWIGLPPEGTAQAQSTPKKQPERPQQTPEELIAAMKTEDDFVSLVGKSQFDKSWSVDHARALLRAAEELFNPKNMSKKAKKKYKSLKKNAK